MIGVFAYQSVLFAQNENDSNLVQFAGMLISGDSTKSNIEPVFYCHVVIKNKKRATISNMDGLFSIVAEPNDTILFSSIGYAPNYLVIPDTITEKKYSVIHILQPDTITLREMVIYPFPTQDEFKREFLNLDIKDDPIANFERTFGKTMPLDFIPPKASDLSAGATVVVSGPLTAIADFIRDGDKRRIDRYRRTLGILDSVKVSQENIYQKDKTFIERLMDDFGLKK